MKMIIEDGPEALDWLRWNGHESPLAHNRFGERLKAISFVEELYAAGARRVFIPQSAIIADKEEILELGGPYADTMIIELPSDGAPKDLEELYRREATVDGFDREKDPLPIVDGRFLVMWWT